MQAKKKPLEQLAASELVEGGAPALAAALDTLRVEEPAKRKAGVIVSSVAELVNKLRHEARVI